MFPLSILRYEDIVTIYAPQRREVSRGRRTR